MTHQKLSFNFNTNENESHVQIIARSPHGAHILLCQITAYHSTLFNTYEKNAA